MTYNRRRNAMSTRITAVLAAAFAVPAFAQNPGPNKVGFPEAWGQGVM